MSEIGTQKITKADMIASFSDVPLAIQGEPELKDFLVVLRHLMDCSQTQSTHHQIVTCYFFASQLHNMHSIPTKLV